MFEQSFSAFRDEYLEGQCEQIGKYAEVHKFYYFVKQGVMAASKLLPAQTRDNVLVDSGGSVVHNEMLPVYFSQLTACVSVISGYCRKFVDWEQVFAGKDIARCFTKVDNSMLVAAISFVRDVYGRYRQGYISYQYQIDPRVDSPDDEVVMKAHNEMWPRLEAASLGDNTFWNWMDDVIDSMQIEYPITDWSYSRIEATTNEVVLFLDNEYERVRISGLKVKKQLKDWPDNFTLQMVSGLDKSYYIVICGEQMERISFKTNSRIYKLLTVADKLTGKCIINELGLKNEKPSSVAVDINKQLTMKLARVKISVEGRKPLFYYDNEKKKYRFRFAVEYRHVDKGSLE